MKLTGLDRVSFDAIIHANRHVEWLVTSEISVTETITETEIIVSTLTEMKTMVFVETEII